MTKEDVVTQILGERKGAPRSSGAAFAPANIALCKYWGKRDETLNLPMTSSLSVSLGDRGTETVLSVRSEKDEVVVNGDRCSPDEPFYRRAVDFLDLFRPATDLYFRLETRNTIPTAAGLASSASGFAALALALNELFQWGLDRKELSILARLGSGSAARSVYRGFVEWHAGTAEDGRDSYAEPLPYTWPELRMGLLAISREAKAIGSRPGMQRTKETSPLYSAWPALVEDDMQTIKRAIAERDFDLLGRTAESNALAMHSTMLAAKPPLCYWLPETVRIMRTLWRCREEGQPLYFTMDAGPNVKLLYPAKEQRMVQDLFPEVEPVTLF